MALTDKLTAIGDAIRAKTGGTDALTLDGMAEAIAAIEAGGGPDILPFTDALCGTVTPAEDLEELVIEGLTSKKNQAESFLFVIGYKSLNGMTFNTMSVRTGATNYNGWMIARNGSSKGDTNAPYVREIGDRVTMGDSHLRAGVTYLYAFVSL